MTVYELLHRMTAEEFTEWKIVHDKIEPFGDLRADLRSGMATSPVLNILKLVNYPNPELSKPSDWIIDLLKKPQVQSAEDMKSLLMGFVQSKGGKINKVKRKRKPI